MQCGIAGAHLSVVLIAAAPAAFAQSYPVKPVRIIVPFAAGGGSDTVARLIASPGMRDRLTAFGASPETMTTAELQRFLVTEKERWARVVQTAGIKGEP